MKGTMNALIMKMKMGEHEHDEAVNVERGRVETQCLVN